MSIIELNGCGINAKSGAVVINDGSKVTAEGEHESDELKGTDYGKDQRGSICCCRLAGQL